MLPCDNFIFALIAQRFSGNHLKMYQSLANDRTVLEGDSHMKGVAMVIGNFELNC